MTTVSAGHPRPQLQRSDWEALDGQWDFALDPDGAWSLPEEISWEQSIIVPFAPETPLSGIAAPGFVRSCWYRRSVDIRQAQHGERLFLMFGAVDSAARVWIDGCYVGSHEGGYTPFSIDITNFLCAGITHEIIVHAEDDPHDLAKPRGKQDWQLLPHAIWYPRTTGIWQTVWALLGSWDRHCLVAYEDGCCTPGAFDVRFPTPQPTLLARLTKALATGKSRADRPASRGGWWERPERLLYPPIDFPGNDVRED